MTTLVPQERCGVCGAPIWPGERRIAVKVGDAAPVAFHGIGRCYELGIQHGTRPIRDDER